jgi:hypothetical protein
MSSANKHENSVHASEERLLAMTDSDLVRFANAQASVHEQVVAELTEGQSTPIGCGSSSRNLLA